MRFDTEARPGDVQDRRGGGGRVLGAGLGLGGMVLALGISLLTGISPTRVMQAMQGGQSAPSEARPGTARNPQEAQSEALVRRATTDIENYWTTALPQMSGRAFQRTQLVLFADSTDTGCGGAEAATGPFYCPMDHLVYVDLAFYGELSQRFGAPGDFAQAYVLAHEFGHHVQSLLGIEARMRAAQQSIPEQRNELSVALELQADCFAGVWGASAARRGLLQAGDLEQGMAAAAAVGDDRMQRMAGRRVAPERWTHGSSQQRVQWFTRGMQSGNVSACDTFGHGTLAP